VALFGVDFLLKSLTGRGGGTDRTLGSCPVSSGRGACELSERTLAVRPVSVEQQVEIGRWDMLGPDAQGLCPVGYDVW
jgi:hypothetical protein